MEGKFFPYAMEIIAFFFMFGKPIFDSWVNYLTCVASPFTINIKAGAKEGESLRKGDLRRAEILRTAEEMFYRNGYEKTTVNEIIAALGISKGGFYHHFDSKETLLQAICDQKAEESYRAALEAVEKCTGAWADKFNAMFDQYGMWKQGNADFMGLLIRVAYREDNLIMRDKLKKRSMELMLPLVNRIVQGGVQAQEFVTPYPDGTGMLVLQLGSSFSDAIAGLLLNEENGPDTAKILEYLELYRYAVEQVLGAPYGSIVLYQMRQMVDVCTTIHEKHMKRKKEAKV